MLEHRLQVYLREPSQHGGEFQLFPCGKLYPEQREQRVQPLADFRANFHPARTQPHFAAHKHELYLHCRAGYGKLQTSRRARLQCIYRHFSVEGEACFILISKRSRELVAAEQRMEEKLREVPFHLHIREIGSEDILRCVYFCVCFGKGKPRKGQGATLEHKPVFRRSYLPADLHAIKEGGEIRRKLQAVLAGGEQLYPLEQGGDVQPLRAKQ